MENSITIEEQELSPEAFLQQYKERPNARMAFLVGTTDGRSCYAQNLRFGATLSEMKLGWSGGHWTRVPMILIESVVAIPTN